MTILRRMGLVTSRKQGSTVYYTLADSSIADLLEVARHILTGVLSGRAELLEDLGAPQPHRAAGSPEG